MRITLALLLPLSLSFSLLAQSESNPSKANPIETTPAPTQAAAETQSRDYQLGAGDVVKITVLDIETLSHEVRISNSGKIHLPFLGVFPVAGLAAHELEIDIAHRLKRQKLLKDPQVQVLITTYRAQTVYILGEVGMPGQYVLKERAYLMDLIALGAGIMESARDYGFLYRRNLDAGFVKPESVTQGQGTEQPKPAQPTYEVIKIDLKSLIAGKKLENNVLLQAGDLFHVLAKDKHSFYVVGDVLRAGVFQIPQGEQLLVSRALSTAGGPSRTAKMSKGMLVRYEGGKRKEIAVDFGAIFKGRQPDFLVQPEDIIFIPGSNFKTIGHGMLGILPSVAERAAYSAGGIGVY